MISEFTVAAVSLGCDKNRVDTENMLYRLIAGGYRLTNDYKAADAIIVNTCAFIESARTEAIDTILEMADYKRIGQCKKLVVTGCLPQKYAAEIREELPEVDAFLGIRDYDGIAGVLKKLLEDGGRVLRTVGADNADNEKRILTTPPHYAYLRVADGCNNRCAYCTIPSIRGAYQSRSIESLVSEAEGLADSGVKELILVAQDVTRYGIDCYKEYKLTELLRRLSKTAIEKLRLMYCYPELVTDELIHEVTVNEKIARYIDIPFQHADDRILKLMNRRSTGDTLRRLMDKLRAQTTHIAVRTTFMVGFPSETDAEFNNLCDFVKDYRPDHVGVFAYSKEDDTPSAKLKPQISAEVKRNRVKILGELHLQNCRVQNAKAVGKTVKAVYEGIDYERGLFIGRTEYNAPDIDTVIYFTGDFADIGKTYDVKITGYEDYDLLGEMIK